MKTGMIYIHGKGGSAEEAAHYQALFPACDVIGFDYRAETPWAAKEEFPPFCEAFCRTHGRVSLIANSIGAYFALHALGNCRLAGAYLISPIVDMERLILDMLGWANATEAELEARGCMETAFGETLSWTYLSWVRSHPLSWNTPTRILYGSGDHLQSMDAIRSFAGRVGAEVTVMQGGEHWFHTEEQMRFLDEWVLNAFS